MKFTPHAILAAAAIAVAVQISFFFLRHDLDLGLDLRDRHGDLEVALERAGGVLDCLLHRIFLVGSDPGFACRGSGMPRV